MSPLIHSLWFSFGEKYLLLLLNLLATMLLARLLTPDDIGAYALGAVLAGLLQALRDFGVGSYLIRAERLDTAELRACLAASLLVAVSLALLLNGFSGLAARFYHDPRIACVLRWLSVNFLLLPYAAISLALLRRQLRFGVIMTINLASATSQLLVAVFAAWAGYRYLSLVWAGTAAASVTLIMSTALRPRCMPWWPAWQGMRRVFAYGSITTLGSIVDELGVAAPELILGRVAGIGPVAIFAKAVGLLNVFNQLITSAVSPVLLPWFSLQARTGQNWQLAYLRTASYLAALAWPFFGFVGLNAGALVRLLYGPQWDACIPLIRVMCLGTALYSMFSMARYLLVALGAVAAQARLDSIAVGARVVLVLLAAPYGLHWLAWAVLGGSLVRCACTLWYLQRIAGIVPAHMLTVLRTSLYLTALSLALPCLAAQVLVPPSALLQLACSATLSLPGWLLGLHFWYPQLSEQMWASADRLAQRWRRV